MNIKKLNKSQFKYIEKLIQEMLSAQTDLNDYLCGTPESRKKAGDIVSDGWAKFFKIVDEDVMKEILESEIMGASL